MATVFLISLVRNKEIATKLVCELQRSGGRYGLATMRIGGGQGMTAFLQRL